MGSQPAEPAAGLRVVKSNSVNAPDECMTLYMIPAEGIAVKNFAPSALEVLQAFPCRSDSSSAEKEVCPDADTSLVQ